MDSLLVANLNAALHETYSKACEIFTFWLSLLPKKYQNDIYGVPWPVILLTLFIGFTLIWLISWRSSTKNRRNKETLVIKEINKLKSQMEITVKEKLEKENKLKTARVELELHFENVKEERQRNDLALEEIAQLQENVKALSHQNKQVWKEKMAFDEQMKSIVLEKEDVLQKLHQANTNIKQLNSHLLKNEKVITCLKKELKENQKKDKQGRKELEEAKNHLTQEEHRVEQIAKLKEDLEKKEHKMKIQITDLCENLDKTKKENETKVKESEIFKDRLLQLRGVKEGLTVDEDDDLYQEELKNKQKEKFNELINVSQIQQRLKQIKIDKERIQFELEAEKNSRKETEAKVCELKTKSETEKNVIINAERDLQLLRAKLTVMQEFYAKREVEMQGKLGREQTERKENESKFVERSDMSQQLQKQLDIYRKMVKDSKKEYYESEKQQKNEINQFEKKVHTNWLASKEAERKLDEAKREVNGLRFKVSDLQQKLYRKEELPFFVKPHSIHGPPFHVSPRPSSIGRQSPNGSLHEHISLNRPERPPSLRSLPRRQPSQEPFGLNYGPPQPCIGDGSPEVKPHLLNDPEHPNFRKGPPFNFSDNPIPPEFRNRPPLFRNKEMSGPLQQIVDRPSPMYGGKIPQVIGGPPLFRNDLQDTRSGKSPGDNRTSIQKAGSNINGPAMTSSPYLEHPTALPGTFQRPPSARTLDMP